VEPLRGATHGVNVIGPACGRSVELWPVATHGVNVIGPAHGDSAETPPSRVARS
jgi:hypothetical protein